MGQEEGAQVVYGVAAGGSKLNRKCNEPQDTLCRHFPNEKPFKGVWQWPNNSGKDGKKSVELR